MGYNPGAIGTMVPHFAGGGGGGGNEGGGGEGAGGSGFVFVTGVTGTVLSGQALVGDILNTGVVSTPACSLVLRSCFPRVRLSGDLEGSPVEATLAVKNGAIYEDAVAITLTNGAGANTILVTALGPDGADAATDSVVLTVSAPPTISSAVASMPSYTRITDGAAVTATAVGASALVPLRVRADKPFTHVEVSPTTGTTGLASTTQLLAATPTLVSGAYQADVVFTSYALGTRSGLQNYSANVRVRDAAGAYSAIVASNALSVIGVGNSSASISAFDYPGTQEALKNVEQATFTYTAGSNDQYVHLSSPNGQLVVVGDPNQVGTGLRTVQRVAGTGDYNDSVVNLRLQVQRLTTGQITTLERIVKIAAVAPTAAVITESWATRGRSGPASAPADYTITITSDQELVAPNVDVGHALAGGGFQNAWTQGATAKIWTRTLRVRDEDAKGLFTWAPGAGFTNLAGLNRAGFSGDATYSLGGLMPRDITFPAASQSSFVLGTQVLDYAKVSAGIWTSNGRQAVKHTLGSLDTNVPDGFSVNGVSVNAQVRINDQAIIDANTTGNLKLLAFQEAE